MKFSRNSNLNTIKFKTLPIEYSCDIEIITNPNPCLKKILKRCTKYVTYHVSSVYHQKIQTPNHSNNKYIS